MAPAETSCCLFSSEWVMLSSAPVAFLCTRISFDLASRVSGINAPDLAILFLFSSEKDSGQREEERERLCEGGTPACGRGKEEVPTDRGWRGW